MSYATKEQLEQLAAYMASQINVPTIGIGGGYAPIGTINFFDATVAPQDWLACDGSVYNIADYPQLAEWYATQHGSKNFYGGNGTTTFAVPDLQGEFLRGTGTNSHANQGSGANVGEHQDGTEHIYSQTNPNGQFNTWGDGSLLQNADNIKNSTSRHSVNTSGSTDGNYSTYTSRPTNTSFLICVKAVIAGEVYSTEERVVGTWIDGKKIYQKTFTSAYSGTGNSTTIEVGNIPANMDRAVNAFASSLANSGANKDFIIYDIFCIRTDNNKIVVECGKSGPNNISGIVCTIQYTKTTD